MKSMNIQIVNAAAITCAAPVIGHQCQNCESIWDKIRLDPIVDMDQRVEPGEDMPSGQCPDPECGAVCHPLKVDLRSNFKIIESDADMGSFHIFGETRELAALDTAYEDKINAALELTRMIASMKTPAEAFVDHFEREPGFTDDGLPQYGAHRTPITAEEDIEDFVAETLDVHEEYRALVALIELARKAI